MRTEIPPKCKLSKWQKQCLQGQAEQFVAEFYRLAIKPPPEGLRSNNSFEKSITGAGLAWRCQALQVNALVTFVAGQHEGTMNSFWRDKALEQ